MASVTPLCCGSIRMDASVLVTGREGERIEAPSLVFLVETDGRTFLVDTSFGAPEVMAERHPDFPVERDPEHTLPAALERAGTAPGAVDGVVLSHLDWDHCYNLDLFDAPVYVQRREVAYAVAPYEVHAARYDAPTAGRTPPWIGADLHPVDGEYDLAPGVTLFPTPGHTVGHQSVAVDTGGETTVVAVDAVPTRENLADGLTLGGAMDEFDWYDSARAVRERATSDEHVLPGHDWSVVPEGPEDVG